MSATRPAKTLLYHFSALSDPRCVSAARAITLRPAGLDVAHPLGPTRRAVDHLAFGDEPKREIFAHSR